MRGTRFCARSNNCVLTAAYYITQASFVVVGGYRMGTQSLDMWLQNRPIYLLFLFIKLNRIYSVKFPKQINQ